MRVFILIIYIATLFLGFQSREGGERTLYLALSLIALVSAVLAGSFLGSDHIGASLSGMISIFMR